MLVRLQIFTVLCTSILYGQATVPLEKCQNRPPITSYWYGQAVLNHLTPPEPSDSHTLISMTITSTGRPKLVLRTDGKIFELFRGSLAGNLYQLLDELERSCRLPSDPAQAAKLVPIKWERSVTAAVLFEKSHREFVAALSKYAVRMQEAYSPLLRTGVSYVSFHSPEYTICYDNGSAHLEITDDETTPMPEQTSPIVVWAHTVEEMAMKNLPNRP